MEFIKRTFSSLRHENFKKFFIGQSISLSGTWMQQTAMGWLVYELTGSKLLLGLIAALGLFPSLFLSVFGGFIADKYPKRTTLIITQIISMVLAFAIGILALTNVIEVWHIKLIALLTGISFAIDLPVKHAFYVEIVDKKDLMNAIALNSSMVNLARILGPVFAGFIMVTMGAGWCFIINGLTFLAILIALIKIKTTKVLVKKKIDPIFKSIKAGFKYVRKNRLIYNLMILMTVVCLFGWSYIVLIPAIAKDIFNAKEGGYAMLMTANGIGAFISALLIAYLADPKLKRLIVNWGLYVFSIALVLLAFCKIYWLSLILMGLIGFGLIAYFSASSGLIQQSASDDMRSRVMGVWALVFGGMQPIGSLLIGHVSQHYGINLTLTLCALICLSTTIAVTIMGQSKEKELKEILI